MIAAGIMALRSDRGCTFNQRFARRLAVNALFADGKARGAVTPRNAVSASVRPVRRRSS